MAMAWKNTVAGMMLAGLSLSGLALAVEPVHHIDRQSVDRVLYPRILGINKNGLPDLICVLAYLSDTTVDSLAKELRLALQYPEGAAV